MSLSKIDSSPRTVVGDVERNIQRPIDLRERMDATLEPTADQASADERSTDTGDDQDRTIDGQVPVLHQGMVDLPERKFVLPKRGRLSGVLSLAPQSGVSGASKLLRSNQSGDIVKPDLRMLHRAAASDRHRAMDVDVQLSGAPTTAEEAKPSLTVEAKHALSVKAKAGVENAASQLQATSESRMAPSHDDALSSKLPNVDMATQADEGMIGEEADSMPAEDDRQSIERFLTTRIDNNPAASQLARYAGEGAPPVRQAAKASSQPLHVASPAHADGQAKHGTTYTFRSWSGWDSHRVQIAFSPTGGVTLSPSTPRVERALAGGPPIGPWVIGAADASGDDEREGRRGRQRHDDP